MHNGMTKTDILMFRDVNVKVQKSHVLHDVSGEVKSGEMLALMGPSGSGKTTLLNTLVGVQPLMSGDISLNGNKITNATKRGIAYVTQRDLFFSNLTLWDCLYFVAMIRLPDSMSKEEKIKRLDYIVDLLDLRKCLHTVIGNGCGYGLSGGEKKRANIGCEILTLPDVMLLDEPTSGLDSCTAESLITTLKQFTEKSNKVVVVSIHQPSSKIFQMFSSLLLLVDGQNAYFGSSKGVLDFFKSVNMHCDPHYNPADFILEQCKKSEEHIQTLVKAAADTRTTSDFSKIEVNDKCGVAMNGNTNLAFDAIGEPVVKGQDFTIHIHRSDTPDVNRHHWPTSTWHQYKWISWRCFKHFGKALFSPLIMTQQIFCSLIVCLAWYQLDRSESTTKDRMGFFYFVSVFWAFATVNFTTGRIPEERPIIRKERVAGYYRLTAYHLARITSELPLIIVLPTVTFTCQYWIIGLSGVTEYFLSLMMLLLEVCYMQAFSFLVGAIFDDFGTAITFSSTFIIFGILFGAVFGKAFKWRDTLLFTGGFYTTAVPWFMTWIKYLSVILYPYSYMCILEFSDMSDITCENRTMTEFRGCVTNSTLVITAQDFLKGGGIDHPAYFYPLVMAGATLLLRIVGYYVFKMRNKLK